MSSSNKQYRLTDTEYRCVTAFRALLKSGKLTLKGEPLTIEVIAQKLEERLPKEDH